MPTVYESKFYLDLQINLSGRAQNLEGLDRPCCRRWQKKKKDGSKIHEMYPF